MIPAACGLSRAIVGFLLPITGGREERMGGRWRLVMISEWWIVDDGGWGPNGAMRFVLFLLEKRRE